MIPIIKVVSDELGRRQTYRDGVSRSEQRLAGLPAYQIGSMACPEMSLTH